MNPRIDREVMQLIDSYAINPDWYQQSHRSFAALAKSRMCKVCQKRVGEEQEAKAPDDYIATIKDCCSKVEGFITLQLPIMETIFRVFLANGNQPLSLEELSQELVQWLGDSATIRVPSLQTLRRLLDNDQYYGLCRILEEEGGEEAKAMVEEGTGLDAGADKEEAKAMVEEGAELDAGADKEEAKAVVEEGAEPDAGAEKEETEELSS